MTGARLVRKTKMIRIYFLKISKNGTGSVDDDNEVAQDEEGEYGQELSRKTSLSNDHRFLKLL